MGNKFTSLKPLIWLLSILLILGLVALLIVAAHDEGMLKSGVLSNTFKIIFQVLYFPLWHIKTSSNLTYFLLYATNISLWSLLVFGLFRVGKKLR